MTALAPAATSASARAVRPAELNDLAPISLAELNEAAALLARTDRKYVVPAGHVPVLLKKVAPLARALEIDGERSFDYVSDYHDSADLRCFLDTAHRRRRRFKVRARRYASTGSAFLEVKTAAGRETVKHRVPWSGDLLDADARAFVDATLADAGIGHAPRLAPVLRTTYRRSTLYLPRDGARVTLDADLTWISLGEDALDRLAGHVVVETKTSAGPCAADRALWASGHRPCALSKYATGMAALDPSLPHNRWHRILSRAGADLARTTDHRQETP